MSYIIFANNAPNYKNFFKPLSATLKKHGKDVVWLLDSEYSKFYNDLSKDENIYIVDQCQSSDSSLMAKEFISENGYWCFYPDYDRNVFYKTYKVSENFYYNIIINVISTLDAINKRSSVSHFIYENPSNAIAIIAQWWCQKMNISYLGLSRSRFPGYVMLSSDWSRDSHAISAKLEQLLNENASVNTDIEQYIKQIVNISPDYMKGNFINNHSVVSKYFNKVAVYNALFKFKFLSTKTTSFQTGIPIKTSVFSLIRNISRSIKINFGLLKYDEVSKEDNYYLYPLHYHPEASTSVLAREYDEFEVIRNIAFNLPHNRFLYVKDHISSKGYFSLSFYNKLKMLPNVKFINSDKNAKLLALNSLGVFTLSSTVGYEALLQNKKVIVFGNVFYSCHRNSLFIDSYKNIKQAFEFLDEKLPDNGDYYNSKFVEAYLNCCKKFTLDFKELDELKQLKSLDIFCDIYSTELGLK